MFGVFGMSNNPTYCWDTSVFIAWLKEEPDKPLADIEAVVSELDAKKAVLVVPVTVFTEMQPSKFTTEQWDRFQKTVRRSNVVVANTTPAIAQKGSPLRDRAEAEGRKIKTGDATIIATAIAYRVDALHTFDPRLINLNGSRIVEGLRITQPLPLSGQKGLL
jgi:predicted nucleic acid-binding protein